MKEFKKLGKCFKCKRIIPVKVLEQIEFYEGHLTRGCFHHKLICLACLEKAEDLREEMEGGKSEDRT